MMSDEAASRRGLKVIATGLPTTATDQQVSEHFSRYGSVAAATVVPAPVDDPSKAAYAMVTFRLAADADVAVVDQQMFPGAQQTLAMQFASEQGEATEDRKDLLDKLNERDPCKLFVGGIGKDDREEEVGDFFSQWGLISVVLRNESWSFVRFATKEGALRLLSERGLMFHNRHLRVSASDSKHVDDEQEQGELLRRAIGRHFEKKRAAMTMVPHAMPAVQGYPGAAPYGGYYPPQQQPALGAPPQGYYGAAQGYYGAAPGFYGAQQPPAPAQPPAGVPPMQSVDCTAQVPAAYPSLADDRSRPY